MKKTMLLLHLALFVIVTCPWLFAETVSLDYSTYLGGSGSDCGYGVAVSSDNYAYITGITDSVNFPTENPYQSVQGLNEDAFVTKLSTSGSLIIYSTYLGGSTTHPYTEPHDMGYNITIDSTGCAYIVGETRSYDFPTINSYQPSLEGSGWEGFPVDDCFVTKISSSGSFLHFSSYLGGTSDDSGRDITIDSIHQVYITGETTSNNFPTWNSYQSSVGMIGREVFVTKFSSSGSNLIYSTYLGGNREESGQAILVDSNLNAYVTGHTNSYDFPTINPYQSSYYGDIGNHFDAFITKFSSTGSNLIFSTYIGGENDEGGHGISIDSIMCVYVAGDTRSSAFPTQNPYQPYHVGSTDIFASKLSSSGSSLVYSTYIGGTNVDWGFDMAIDIFNCVYIVGKTASSNFPTKNPYQTSLAGGYDAFITKVASSGSLLLYSTSFGGGSDDEGYSIYLDSKNKVYIAGRTWSGNFPTVNPYQAQHAGGNYDAFISRLFFTEASLTDRFVIESGDYSGDGKTDIAIFRPDTGLWAVKDLGRIYFGSPGDIPVSGDYDGDGYTEVSIYRPSTGLWAIKDVTRCYFGGSDDMPVPTDYDGDGSCDIGIYARNQGCWAIRGSTRVYFGDSNDFPIPGDYSGDGTAEIAVFRPSTGLWAIRGYTRCHFGAEGDIPMPAEYQWYGTISTKRDYRTQIAIFRPTTGLWAIRGYKRVYFGDWRGNPIAGDFDGNSLNDIAIFRPGSGLWAVKGVTRVYFGKNDDLPVTK